ncbi:MAG: OB-fold domain-containing protein [Acidimicrobiia bacterium]|nr:OB-fold domain-containing protein [Acidimicrobiia bacterium]
MAKTRVPAVEGWFTMGAEPALVGNRCAACGTVFFPRAEMFCRNPRCDSDSFDDVELSRTGTVWSYATNHYEPPQPYMAPDPFEPYTVAAVELEAERMVVLGMVDGDSTSMAVGRRVELVLATLFEDDEHEYVVWKWRPAE